MSVTDEAATGGLLEARTGPMGIQLRDPPMTASLLVSRTRDEGIVSLGASTGDLWLFENSNAGPVKKMERQLHMKAVLAVSWCEALGRNPCFVS